MESSFILHYRRYNSNHGKLRGVTSFSSLCRSYANGSLVASSSVPGQVAMAICVLAPCMFWLLGNARLLLCNMQCGVKGVTCNNLWLLSVLGNAGMYCTVTPSHTHLTYWLLGLSLRPGTSDTNYLIWLASFFISQLNLSLVIDHLAFKNHSERWSF